MLSTFLTSLHLEIIATAILRITDEFHSLSDVAWYGSSLFLVTASFQAGCILKIVYLTAIFILEVGSLICSVAPSSVALIIGRAITGLGAAGANTGSFTLAAFSAPHKLRPVFTGLIGLSYVASVVGPLLGGVFTDRITWRWCFYINLPAGADPAVSKSASSAILREKLISLDFVGTSLVLRAVVTFILAVQYGGQIHPRNSSAVIGFLVGSVLITIVFTIWGIYMDGRAAFVPRLVKRNAVVSVVGFFFGSYIITIYYLPIYFQSIDGTSHIDSCVRNLPSIILVSVSALASGIGISKTSYPAPFLVGGAAIAMIACAKSDTLDMAMTTAILITLGNRLLITLPHSAPGIDPTAIIAAGAADLQKKVAYMDGLKASFALSFASMRVAFIFSIFTGWKGLPAP
ncbi:efflux pump antibiotic resistance protein [Nemania abortiva]|nr:efflux pump antibiotic resistance protein [Nemania abortiva]